jgi:uncharacterized membrane protein
LADEEPHKPVHETRFTQTGPTAGASGSVAEGAKAIVHQGPLASLRNSFLTGIVISAPILITIALIYWLVTGPLARLDDMVQGVIPDSWLPPALKGLTIPGLGVLLTIVLLTVVGIMAKNIIGQFFIGLGQRFLDSTPVVRSLYGFFKNVFEMALQQSEQSFQEVALVEYPRPGIWTLCFVVTRTKGEAKHVLADMGDDVTNIFVPTTPNPTSGFLLLTRRSELRILEMSVEDGAKMIFSAGLVAPDYTPLAERAVPEAKPPVKVSAAR